jgi:hypothetical protein
MLWRLNLFASGRTKQNWRPLWILAELAGDEWTEKLNAGIGECEKEARSELSFTDYLLKALRQFCREYQKRPGVLARKLEQRDHVFTEDILSLTEGLNADKEAPWKANKGELSSERLAGELRAFKVTSTKKLIGLQRARGYSHQALLKVFERYLK